MKRPVGRPRGTKNPPRMPRTRAPDYPTWEVGDASHKEGIAYWKTLEYRCGSYYFAVENRAAQLLLGQLGPEDWAARIAKIKDRDVRNHVACLIWWDHFGNVVSSRRFPHLDKYINAPFVRVSLHDTVEGLMQCGLTRDMAGRRARGSES